MFKLIIFCFALFAISFAFPDGAPAAACGTQLPEHGFGPQTSTPPFTITPSRTAIRAGTEITFTLASTGAAIFRGFIFQVVSGLSHRGTVLAGAGYQVLLCNNNPTSATHTENSDKNSVTISWRAPVNFIGDYRAR
jgi:hypothetical protein